MHTIIVLLKAGLLTGRKMSGHSANLAQAPEADVEIPAAFVLTESLTMAVSHA
jgi:hypothetical protein